MDTNILIYRYIWGEHTRAAQALAIQDPEWHAPQLWLSEFRNVLAGEIRRGMALAQARAVMKEAEMQMEPCAHAIESDGILDLAAETQCTAYDLEFVVLAQTLAAPLYTLDGQILRAFPRLARPLMPV